METVDAIFKAIVPAGFWVADRPDTDPVKAIKATRPFRGKLYNQVAVVTGGDTPIGRSIAAALAGEGAHLVIIFSSDEQQALETKRMVESLGRYAMILKGELGDAESSRGMIRKAVFKFGQINILVNHIDHKHYKSISSCLHLTKAALVFMKSNSCIINAVSCRTDMPESVPELTDSGDDILHFTTALRESFVHASIRICGIAPFSYNYSKATFGTGRPDRMKKVEEIATLFSHLASADGKVLNDHVIFPTREKAFQQEGLSKILGAEAKNIYA